MAGTVAVCQSVEVPKALRKRPKDRRGYPIPFIVFRDANKRPHFTINDQRRVVHVIRKKLCGLCGEKLKDGAWFVGGSDCFTSPLGAFIDPPMHEDCAKYALQVCPFLAAPSYSKRIDDRTITPGAVPLGTAIVATDDGQMPARQPPLFGLGQCAAYEAVPTGPGQFILRPVAIAGQSWMQLEFWKDGERVEGPEL